MTLPLSVLQNIAKQRGKDTTDVFQTSIVERYWARPNKEPFPMMCLADFVANYRVVQAKYSDRDDEDDQQSDDEDIGNAILLQDKKGAITRRKKQAVIRYIFISRVSKELIEHCELMFLLLYLLSDFKSILSYLIQP